MYNFMMYNHHQMYLCRYLLKKKLADIESVRFLSLNYFVTILIIEYPGRRFKLRGRHTSNPHVLSPSYTHT